MRPADNLPVIAVITPVIITTALLAAKPPALVTQRIPVDAALFPHQCSHHRIARLSGHLVSLTNTESLFDSGSQSFAKLTA